MTWADRTSQCHSGAVPPSLLQLPTRHLEGAVTRRGILLQQHPVGNNQGYAVLRQLRLPPPFPPGLREGRHRPTRGLRIRLETAEVARRTPSRDNTRTDGTRRTSRQDTPPRSRIETGQQGLAALENIKTTRPSSKLDHKLIGPYTILEKVGTKAYKLDLPPTVRIHPVFHISLLEPVKNDSNPIPGHTQPPPPPIEVNNEEEWEVEEILDSRRHRNKRQYRVKWTGFHDPDRSWYPAENFENAPGPIQRFHQEYPNKPAPIV
jgi:hypothetical protein